MVEESINGPGRAVIIGSPLRGGQGEKLPQKVIRSREPNVPGVGTELALEGTEFGAFGASYATDANVQTVTGKGLGTICWTDMLTMK